MVFSTTSALIYALIPMGAALLGGLLAYIFKPRPLLMKFLSHFVAGIIVAAVAVELVPRIIDTGEGFRVGVSFLAGAASMLLIRVLFSKLEKFSTFSTAIASGLDLLLDGILIAIAFYASQKTGVLIALSLSMCAFLLNFTVTSLIRQKQWERPMQIITIFLIAAALPVGAWLGGYLIDSTRAFVRLEILSFGTAALLYLGAEELLGGSHSGRESWLTSSGFFLGFVLILFFR